MAEIFDFLKEQTRRAREEFERLFEQIQRERPDDIERAKAEKGDPAKPKRARGHYTDAAAESPIAEASPMAPIQDIPTNGSRWRRAVMEEAETVIQRF